MALVDYSDDDSADEEPPAKRPKPGIKVSGSEAAPKPPSDLPPLPPSFHDLYASTVRQSVSDDPNLHQGRRRLIPHVPGNWPSHVYVDWHPTSDQHDRLARLLSSVEDQLPSEFQLHSLLTSDLGVPLPLHISLSRPLSLPTADKDAFLDRLTAAVRSSGVGPFDVAPGGLGWFRSPDSERSFLILRVAIPGAAVGAADVDAGAPCAASALNPQLLQLLSRCNGVAAAFGQPPLYQETPTAPVGSAFHISLGWSFGLPDEGSSVRSLKVLREPGFADVRAWKIPVPGVKVKIGNVIHHVSLSRAKGRRDGPR